LFLFSNHSLFLVAKDLDKSCEQINGVQIHVDALVDGVVAHVSLGSVHDFLGVVKQISREKSKTEVEVDVVQSGRMRVDHLEERNSKQATKAKSKRATPVQELFARGIVCHCAERSDSDASGNEGVIDDRHGVDVDNWEERDAH